MKDYFSGLGLFFNRQTWSHGAIFIVILAFFLCFHIFQKFTVILFLSLVSIIPTIGNVFVLIYLSGCGIFIGFLLLGVIAITGQGRYLLYKSRFRHLMSPLVIGGFILLFITVVPIIINIVPAALKETTLAWFIIGPNGVFDIVFRACWVVMVFLQVILFGLTIIKGLKWIWSYVKVPEFHGTAAKYRIGTIVQLLLIPIAILFWLPLFYILLIGAEPVVTLPPMPLLALPENLRWLLTLSVFDYRLLLWLLTPIVIIVTLVGLWRGRAQLALALAGFGILYSALIFYYRYRVYQYFINWVYIILGLYPRPNIGSGLFEILMILITFLMCLQGIAKYQRDISPNPFGLFALMIGTLVFFQIWMLNPTTQAWLLIESFSMFSAALSAFLATVVFAALPIGYTIYRLRRQQKP